jgi:serine/threonine protein kinase
VQPGSRIAHFEVLSLLGAGGMGEVYRARDTRLGRDVAIKVLPVEFATDPDRLRRFEQEAHAVAALNHPNILAIHDVGTHEGAPYIVTELLEGESLHDRLKGGALTARKAVEVAVQIAQGLAGAHEKGIIHRDLKPANVFITKDGHVKILDFGLAKLAARRSRDDRARATTVMEATDAGTVLGTVAYMSPEQVRGQAVDQRSDIFAFGVVLYEMLSGKRAFGGDTAADTMSAILTKDPADLSGLDLGVTPSLERVVRRCLEKDANQRFESAHDVVFALEVASAASGPSVVAAVIAPPSRHRTVVRWTLGALAAVVVMGIAVVAPRALRRGHTGARQFDLALPKGYRLHGPQNAVDISPDGRRIVFAASPDETLGMWGGEPRLFIRDLNAPDAVPLPGGEGGFQPVFSPTLSR